MKKLKEIVFHGLMLSFVFVAGVSMFGFLAYKVYGSLSNVSSGTPLTAGNWNDMISNFFWGSGSGGIFYNGKVGIGTSSPNKSLHIKTSAGTNAELDIQSGNLPHWAIYQDEASQDIKIRNGVNKVAITNGGVLNAIGGLCINSDCKTSWSQVGGAGVGTYQFTGTSESCSATTAGKIKYVAGTYYGCDGTTWFQMSTNKKGTLNNPGVSCKEIYDNAGSTGNGLYYLNPDGTVRQVYCDMTNGGRTLVFSSQIVAGTANTPVAYSTNLATISPTGSMVGIWTPYSSINSIKFSCDGSKNGSIDYSVQGSNAESLAIYNYLKACSNGVCASGSYAIGGNYLVTANDTSNAPDFMLRSTDSLGAPIWGTYDDYPYSSAGDDDMCNSVSYSTRGTGVVPSISSASSAYFYIWVK